MIEIIPNCIPKDDQDYIENLISSGAFDWYHAEYSNYDISDDIELKSKKLSYLQGYSEFRQFRHVLYNGTGNATDLLNQIFPRLCKGINFSRIDLLNMRINMLLPLRDQPLNAIGAPHVDWGNLEENYFTGLYYINDCDGDTIIYNETYKDDIPDKLTVNQIIKPAKGTLVLFNTYHIHSGCLPSSGRRMVINFNFKASNE